MKRPHIHVAVGNLTSGESTDYGNSRPQDVCVAQVACCEGARA